MEEINTEALRIQREFSKATDFDSVHNKEDSVGDSPKFGDVLSNLIKDVDQAQKDADVSIQQLAAGETTSIQDVVMKLEEADLAFQMMKEVRNKLLEAYKETISMSS